MLRETIEKEKEKFVVIINDQKSLIDQLKSQLRNSESHSSCSEELHKLSESKSRSSNNQIGRAHV